VNLSLADKVRIESDRWISDEIINASQCVLREQFPEIAGFRSSLYFSIISGSIQTTHTSIDRLRDDKLVSSKSFSEHLARAQFRQLQILFVNGNHWVTVSNIHTGPPNEIHVYDSKPPNYDQFFKHQVAAVFRQSAPEIRLIWPPMCLQPNDNDCGCYAVAAAVALAHKEKPQTQNFKNEVSQSCSLIALVKQF
jgi:hypothetical protein